MKRVEFTDENKSEFSVFDSQHQTTSRHGRSLVNSASIEEIDFLKGSINESRELEMVSDLPLSFFPVFSLNEDYMRAIGTIVQQKI